MVGSHEITKDDPQAVQGIMPFRGVSKPKDKPMHKFKENEGTQTPPLTQGVRFVVEINQTTTTEREERRNIESRKKTTGAGKTSAASAAGQGNRKDTQKRYTWNKPKGEPKE